LPIEKELLFIAATFVLTHRGSGAAAATFSLVHRGSGAAAVDLFYSCDAVAARHLSVKMLAERQRQISSRDGHLWARVARAMFLSFLSVCSSIFQAVFLFYWYIPFWCSSSIRFFLFGHQHSWDFPCWKIPLVRHRMYSFSRVADGSCLLQLLLFCLRE
jgi:hypothetical protein